MGKRFASGALIAALTAGILAVSAGSASALSSSESQFVSKINAERTSRGKKALTVKSDLVSVARRHSARMAAKGSIWHNPNLGDEVDGWTLLGENVGKGPSVDSLHRAFMDSPGHRANILESDFNQAGVGVVVEDGTIYVTEVFAKRKTTTVTKTTTTVQKTSTTTSKTSTTSKPRTTSAPRVAAQAAPARPVAPPKPKPVEAAPRTVDLLVRMVGMDAEEGDV